MRGGVVHPDAEIAAATVEIERARLEHGLGVQVVEVVEVDEVLEQLVKVALVVRHPDRVRHRAGFGGHRQVVVDQDLDPRLRVAGKNGLDASEPELFHRGALLRGDPRFMSGIAGLNLLPFDGADLCLLGAEQRRNRRLVERCQRSGPRRVDALEQRQRASGLDARERQHLQLRGLCRLLRRQPRIELRDPAAVEPVVDLHPNRAERLVARSGVGAGIPVARPERVSLEVGEEGIEPRPIDAQLAGPVGNAAAADDGVVNDLAQGGIGTGIRRNHAVAVETGSFEHSADVGDVGHRQRRRFRRAAMSKDVPHGAEQSLARGFRIVDRFQREAVRAGNQRGEVLQALRAPAQRCQDLPGADAAVLVEIEELQGPLLELQSLHGTAQRDPQLLIELMQVGQIVAALQSNLVQPAHSVEPELICHEVPRSRERLPHLRHFVEGPSA
ncbi:MAG: hypothetical protein E6J58_21045 [Deltaproteobacteria bacterium]|nr:MAG: hypothetical protein E6J58_21045 [Deltaproteobacteria bacterium]